MNWWDELKQVIIDYGWTVAVFAIGILTALTLTGLANILGYLFGWSGYMVVICPALIFLIGMAFNWYD